MYNLKFIDSYIFTQDSLSNLVHNLSEITKDKLIDNIRSMTGSLSQPITKRSQINKKEPKNKSIHIVRSMIDLLSQTINKKSKIGQKKNIRN